MATCARCSARSIPEVAAGRSTRVDPSAYGGFGAVPVLLLSRLRMLRNSALRSGRAARGWTLLLGLGAAAMLLAGRSLAAAALAVDDPGPDRIATPVAGLLGTVSVFTGVTAITFALGALYLARDLDPLLTSPVPPRAVLLAKLLIQLLTGVAIGAVVVTAPLATYLGNHGALSALPWIGLCVVAMAVFPLLAGTWATVLAVRLLPARRVRDAGGLLVTLMIFGVTALNLVTRGPAAFTSTPGFLAPDRGGVAGSALLPTGWTVRAAVAAVRGDVATTLAWGLPMVLGAALLLLLTARVLEAPFVAGFQRSQESGRGRVRRRGRARVAASGRPPAWRVLLVKDLRETIRDPSQIGQLALPLALFALYVASPTAVGPGRVADLPPWFGVLLTAGFASLFAASGVALRGVGMEGRRLWILRASPVDPRSVLAAKFLAGSAIAVALGLLLLGIGLIHLHLGVVDAAGVALRLMVLVSGLVGMAVGIGAVRPRLDWTDPRRSVGVGVSLGFLAVGSTYLGLAYLLIAAPYARGAHPATALLAATDAGIVLLALVAAAIPLAIGAVRLRDMDL